MKSQNMTKELQNQIYQIKEIIERDPKQMEVKLKKQYEKDGYEVDKRTVDMIKLALVKDRIDRMVQFIESQEME